MTAIALAAFLISLDGFILNVAIPTIASELGVRVDMGTWLITVFSTGATAAVPASGFFSTRYGGRSIFLIGLTLFAVTSLYCGFAPTFPLLLLGRTLQGISAGLVTPVSLTLILDHFPPAKKTVGVGFWSFFVMVGPAMGPMIGGWLSDYRWHWLFFMNLPICLITLAIVLILLDKEKKERDPLPIDWLGICLLFTWVGSLQVALNRWNVDDWLRSNFIISMFSLSAFSFVWFIIREYFAPSPVMHLCHLRRREFLLPSLSTAFAMGMIFASITLDALWVQRVLGYTPAWSGLTLSPIGIFPLFCYPLMGRIAGKLDPRIWVIASYILISCTFFWLSRITVYSAYWQLAMPRLIQGIGFAMFTVPNAALVIRNVDAKEINPIVSLYSFMRMLSVGLAVAGGITLWIFRSAFYETRLSARTNPNSPVFEGFLNTFAPYITSPMQEVGLTNIALVDQASTLALADIYYLFGWVFLSLTLLTLFYKVPSLVLTPKPANN